MRAMTSTVALAAALLMSGATCLAADAAAPASGVKLTWYRNSNGQPDYSPAVGKLIGEGIELINQNKWEAAIEKFTLALKQQPDGAGIYENRGICYQKLGQYRQAIADYTRALELDQSMAAILYNNRGYSYKALGKPGMAAADFTQALKLDPRFRDPLLLERGRLLVDLDDVNGAEQDFDQALEFPAIRSQAYSELSYIAIQRQDPASCITLATKAIEINSSYVEGWVNRGACELSTGKFAAAEKDLSAAITLKPRFAIAYLNRAAAYVGMHKCANAKKDAQTALQIDPTFEEAARKLTAPCAQGKPAT